MLLAPGIARPEVGDCMPRDSLSQLHVVSALSHGAACHPTDA